MTVTWGILSTAEITRELIPAFGASAPSRLLAIGSRDLGRAQTWASAHGIPRAHGSYDELLADEDLDAVYIPLPNAMHVEWTLKALAAGKHVLCEKPLALTSSACEAVFEAATARGRHVMEGYMFVYHPIIRRTLELMSAGALGTIQTIRAWHGFTVERPKTDIRCDPAIGGGALADVGCYCIAAALLLLNEDPCQYLVTQRTARSGVDATTAGVLTFPSGTALLFDCSLQIPESAGLIVVGDVAQLEIEHPWIAHPNGRLWFVDRLGRRALVDCGSDDPYRLEVDNFCSVIDGTAEPGVARALSLRVAHALEAITTAAARVPVAAQPAGGGRS
jgi:predicted dehydrogenase